MLEIPVLSFLFSSLYLTYEYLSAFTRVQGPPYSALLTAPLKWEQETTNRSKFYRLLHIAKSSDSFHHENCVTSHHTTGKEAKISCKFVISCQILVKYC